MWSFNFESNRGLILGIGILSLEMTEEWGQIMHILDREDKEFQEAMKVQVGTTFSLINNSSKM